MELISAAAGAVGNVVGGILNNNAAKKAANKAYERQKTILQNQVQWRVADAEAAGLHPLAAIGLSPASGPSPAAVFDTGIGQAATDIGRAIENYRSPDEKLSNRLAQLQLERGQLENDLLRTQIASERVRLNQQSTPGLPPVDSTAEKPGSAGYINVPGLGNVYVGNTKLGQQAEDAHSELGNITVLPGFLHDMGHPKNLALIKKSFEQFIGNRPEDRWLYEKAHAAYNWWLKQNR